MSKRRLKVIIIAVVLLLLLVFFSLFIVMPWLGYSFTFIPYAIVELFRLFLIYCILSVLIRLLLIIIQKKFIKGINTFALNLISPLLTTTIVFVYLTLLNSPHGDYYLFIILAIIGLVFTLSAFIIFQVVSKTNFLSLNKGILIATVLLFAFLTPKRLSFDSSNIVRNSFKCQCFGINLVIHTYFPDREAYCFGIPHSCETYGQFKENKWSLFKEIFGLPF